MSSIGRKLVLTIFVRTATTKELARASKFARQTVPSTMSAKNTMQTSIALMKGTLDTA